MYFVLSGVFAGQPQRRYRNFSVAADDRLMIEHELALLHDVSYPRFSLDILHGLPHSSAKPLDLLIPVYADWHMAPEGARVFSYIFQLDA